MPKKPIDPDKLAYIKEQAMAGASADQIQAGLRDQFKQGIRRQNLLELVAEYGERQRKPEAQRRAAVPKKYREIIEVPDLKKKDWVGKYNHVFEYTVQDRSRSAKMGVMTKKLNQVKGSPADVLAQAKAILKAERRLSKDELALVDGLEGKTAAEILDRAREINRIIHGRTKRIIVQTDKPNQKITTLTKKAMEILQRNADKYGGQPVIGEPHYLYTVVATVDYTEEQPTKRKRKPKRSGQSSSASPKEKPKGRNA